MRARFLPLIAFVVGAAALAWVLPPEGERLAGGARIVDGDSLHLDGRSIRLEGIDAPELAQTCGRDGREESCGREARRALIELIGDDEVVCRLSGTDKYRRTLARCTAGGRDLNARMVSGGMAVSYGGYRAQESEARGARRGLWAGPFERPADWRAKRRERPEGS